MEQTVISQNVSYILIIDDTLENLQLLSRVIKERGYKVRPAPNGRLALQAAQNEPPALILLDINMPEMNGYEVCKLLKANEKLKDIPVIFISAMNETLDKVKAFSLGGVDYITKPFQFEEVIARVEAHLELRQQKLLLQEQKCQLQESYDRLRELESMRDSLVHMIVHDMRTPLTCISGFLQLIELLERKNLTEKGIHYLGQAQNSTSELMEMISSLLDINKMESGEMKLDLITCDLSSLAREVVVRSESLKGSRQIVLEFSEQPVKLACDCSLISRVIQNLLSNALKFAPEQGGEIRLGIEPGVESIRMFIKDNGQGIPPEYHNRLFKKFGQVEAKARGQQKYSTGLGLAFCKLAVEAHGGSIGVDSVVGKGSAFWFVLPRKNA